MHLVGASGKIITSLRKLTAEPQGHTQNDLAIKYWITT